MPSESSPFRNVDPASDPLQQPDAASEASTPPEDADVGAPAKPTGAVGAPKNIGEQVPSPAARATTRAATAWLATAVALIVLVLLIILILQNQKVVQVSYLGFTGSIPLGTALLIAAVAGAAVVTIVGVVRLTQLRFTTRRRRRRDAEREKDKH
jgi:uncharacterized integral membrane protein